MTGARQPGAAGRYRRVVVAIAIALAAGAAARAAAPQPPDVALPDPAPAAPLEDGLVAFEVDASSTVRHAVFAPSIAVDAHRVVRFALVVRSSAGVRNVSYEAIDCASAARRLIAIGRTDGSWRATPASPWRPIGGTATHDPQYRLLLRTFCAGGGAAGDAAALVGRLRTGRVDLP